MVILFVAQPHTFLVMLFGSFGGWRGVQGWHQPHQAASELHFIEIRPSAAPIWMRASANLTLFTHLQTAITVYVLFCSELPNCEYVIIAQIIYTLSLSHQIYIKNHKRWVCLAMPQRSQTRGTRDDRISEEIYTSIIQITANIL